MNTSLAPTGNPSTGKPPVPQMLSEPQLWSPANPHFMPQKSSAPSAVPTVFPDPATIPVPSQPPAPTTAHVQPAVPSQPEAPMDANMISDCYASLLGLAETFRTMSPPNMRLAVHCLKAALNFKLPVNVEARTHLQIGRLLFHYSKNDEQTQSHLEKARTLGAHLRAKDDSIKFEAAALLAEFFERKQAQYTERDVNSACEILAMGSEFAQMHNSDYTRGLFLLSKCMLLLASRQFPEVTSTLSDVNSLIEGFRGTNYHREALRVFYLVLHVSFYLLSGQAKSARPILKQLHQSIQQFAAMDEMAEGAIMNEIDRFQWMPREHMVILVYLITVMHWMQVGMLDRAKRSAEKALTQIEKLSVFDTSPLLTVFHLSLLEHTAMGRLVMGVQTAAAQDIGQACRICQANPGLMFKRLPQLHTLIGLYAMSMNCMDQAENQFKYALRVSSLSGICFVSLSNVCGYDGMLWKIWTTIHYRLIFFSFPNCAHSQVCHNDCSSVK
ncbi:unnamed protein product [Echinostoma caproni]|uniref:Cohesin loading complex subunit SCC4 homolog n=1 Tax=Echinostoma caproni TaxID=27848 RepID=A0A183AVR8_9TREM|nr:unnamed protein product [Echinostoma caproni]